jgi:hypothetical protein
MGRGIKGRTPVLVVSVVGTLIFCASAAAAPPNKSCGPCVPPLIKFGGATAVTQQTPTIDLVFWGSHWTNPRYAAHNAVMSAEGALFFALSNNTGAAAGYNNILKQYLGNFYVPFYGGAYVDNNDPPASLQSSDFQAEVDRAIRAVPMWSAGQNVQFMIFPEERTTGGALVKVSFAGEEAPDFCGYHDFRTGTANGTEVYDVEPWTGAIPGCLTTYGNGATTFQKIVSSMTTVSTHEYAEAATDPFWNSTTGQKGWRTNQASLFEIGDLCQYPGVLLVGVGSVQYLWSNAANAGRGACVT